MPENTFWKNGRKLRPLHSTQSSDNNGRLARDFIILVSTLRARQLWHGATTKTLYTEIPKQVARSFTRPSPGTCHHDRENHYAFGNCNTAKGKRLPGTLSPPPYYFLFILSSASVIRVPLYLYFGLFNTRVYARTRARVRTRFINTRA